MASSKSSAEIEAAEFVANTPIPEEYKDGVKEFVTKIISHPAYNTEYKWSLEDFELGSLLSRGKFGRVYIAREKKTGYLVAMKTLNKLELVKGLVERQVLREIEIQSNLKHPNVLELMTWFHDEYRIYLALEYAAKGVLYKHLIDGPGGHFDEHSSAKYIYQVADALNYCHKMKVIHRDIKPENLLLALPDDIKLANFGWSVHAPLLLYPSLRRNTMCGTFDYLPPEIVDGKPYSQHVDSWCLGILCFEFLVGYPPFESKLSDEICSMIRKADIKFPSHVPSGAIDLISKLLKKTPVDRIALEDVIQHSWIISNK